MKILFLTYYFEPDLCAGSFRNSSLFEVITSTLKPIDSIEVITTHPNRYGSYIIKAEDLEIRGKNIKINRIKIPKHNIGFLGQIKSFTVFYFNALNMAREGDYDLVYASSSRLFTAFLGAKLAKRNKAKLYLDIRDIFRESILDVFNNPIIRIGLDLFLRPIEKYTFSKATHINLVSQGFKTYFTKYKKCNYSYYTNGIDSIFLEVKKENNENSDNLKKIIYAGNIGEGQGLHIIIPKIAEGLKDDFVFIIFGDGGAKHKLINALKEFDIKNVFLKEPINRILLIQEYQKADFLFLHLNKHKAFKRVLPSKLFEYGAFDKPIIAGVDGYSAKFIKENISNCIVFNPGDANALISELNRYEYKRENRDEFIRNFSREHINKMMAESIISL